LLPAPQHRGFLSPRKSKPPSFSRRLLHNSARSFAGYADHTSGCIATHRKISGGSPYPISTLSTLP
jgi:hypothetical protein